MCIRITRQYITNKTGGDIVALEAKHHIVCLSALYRKAYAITEIGKCESKEDERVS